MNNIAAGLLSLCLAAAGQSQTVVKAFNQDIRPLVGQLDKTPMFNSNSPEVVKTEGVLLSTFTNRKDSDFPVNLNYPMQGRFDIFTHHIANEISEVNPRTLYEGILINNPTQKTVIVKILQAASYLSQPDAPFVSLPNLKENPDGTIYAGPGDRVAYNMIAGIHQPGWPKEIVLPPKTSKMLMNLPIPVKDLTPYLNGRSTLIRCDSDGPVVVANLALYARKENQVGEPSGLEAERAPTLDEWQQSLDSGKRAGPEEPKASCEKNHIIYGRVDGVQQGSTWQANLADKNGLLEIAAPGSGIDFVISSLIDATFGTGVDDSAKLFVHYGDTACEAHGNYGVEYKFTMPLYNPGKQNQTITLSLQTPLKTNEAEPYLQFLKADSAAKAQVYFRGNLRLEYKDDKGKDTIKFVHIVSRKGQMGEPFLTITLKPGERRTVKIDFIYPGDCTPPQVLTVSTKDNN